MSKARGLADLGNVYDDGALSNRNLIINGAMNVAQRGTSSTSDGYTTVDRWRPAVFNEDQLAYTYSQSTDAPSGFGYSFKINVDTAETTLDADESWKFEQRLEGQDLQLLGKGTSDAKSLTVSFWVKSSTTGTYLCELDDRDNTRAYSQAYTISSANTWEYKTLTYVGDTTGAIDNDNGQSFRLTFMLAAGSDLTSGTLTTGWTSRVDANRFVGQTNLMAATNNYWQITGVQLEVGDTATPFEHMSYGDELQRCMRYYQAFGRDFKGSTGISWVAGSRAGSNLLAFAIPISCPLRASPTVTAPADNKINVRDGSGTDLNADYDSLSGYSNTSVNVNISTTLTPNSNAAAVLYMDVGTGFEFNAEL
jgi:hypothetical protein